MASRAAVRSTVLGGYRSQRQKRAFSLRRLRFRVRAARSAPRSTRTAMDGMAIDGVLSGSLWRLEGVSKGQPDRPSQQEQKRDVSGAARGSVLSPSSR
jgi:hypothetical protein